MFRLYLLPLVLPLVARAHGPTPAGADLLLIVDGDAHAARLSRGAAIKLDGEWRFLCQSRWGGPDAPAMLSTLDEAVLLPAVDGLHRLTPDGRVAPTGHPDLTSSSTRTLLSVGDTVLALTGFSGGSTVWRVDDQALTPIVVSERTIKAVAANGTGVLVAWLSEARDLELQTLTLAGEPEGPVQVIPGPFEGTLVLTPLADRLFVRTLSSSRYRLYEIVDGAATLLWDSKEPVHGPVSSGDATLVALDRSLYRLEGHTPVLLDDERRLTCLHARGALGAVACVLPDIRPVDASGTFGPPLFALRDLMPPILDDLDEKARLGCELDWLDLATDAGLPVASPVEPGPESDPVEPAVAEPPPTSAPAAGCSAGGRSTPVAAWLAVAAMMVWARRRYC